MKVNGRVKLAVVADPKTICSLAVMATRVSLPRRRPTMEGWRSFLANIARQPPWTHYFCRIFGVRSSNSYT